MRKAPWITFFTAITSSITAALLVVPSPASASSPPLPDVPRAYAGSIVLNETGAQIASDAAWQNNQDFTWGGGTITASGNYLRLHSTGAVFGSGGVRSTTRFWKTGVFEFRVRLPAGPNGKLADWPALWFSGRPWPNEGEIDLLEGLGGTDQVTYHYGTITSQHSISTSWRLPVYSPRPGPGWHTIDLVWAPSWARVYTDGRLLTILQGSWFTPGPEMMRLQMNSGQCPHTTSFCGDNPGSSASMYVAYVRVWRFR